MDERSAQSAGGVSAPRSRSQDPEPGILVCDKCGGSHKGKRCSSCLRHARRRSRALSRRFNKPFFLLLVGMAGLFLTVRRYPLLDRNTFYWIALAFFFVPTLLLVASSVLKRLERDAGPLFALFCWCAAASIALCGGVLLNGALDGAPAAPVHARVLRKRISRGRSSITYLAVVESWRSGQTEEELPVSRAQFQALGRDSSIGVELHRGWLGLPWYGRISIR